MTSSNPLSALLPDFGIRQLSATDLDGRDPGLDTANFAAGVALCPKSLEDIKSIVSWCAKTKTPIVMQGGRTGLAGGTVSAPGQLVVMMEHMNTIRNIDAGSGVAIVDAGVTLAQLEDAVSSFDLTVGIDLAARGTCTIGGMVATNAGGGEAFRNGMIRQRVLGLEVVLPDGAVMSDLKKVIKANEGYDVKQMFIGSEGTLGVITGVVLKLEKAIGNRQTVLASTKNAAEALSYFHRLHAVFGANLLSAEIMWKDYFVTTCQALGFEGRFGNLQGETYFIADVDVPQGDNSLLEVLGESLEVGEISDAVIAKNEQECNDIWLVREESFLIDKAYPGGCWFDISIPLSELDSFVKESTARVHAIDPALKVFVMGHLGDGNLHYTIAKDAPVEHLYSEIATALYTGLSAIGGSFSAEHGIGTEKQSSLCKFADPTKLSLMRAIKATIDPMNIMNPGKVLPPQ
jgi:FAD/FMN-containing dehydrogenase